MRTSTRSLMVFLLLGGLLSACSDDSPTEPTTDEDPVEVETVTESFSGEIQLGETSCHNFFSTQFGDIDMALLALEPLATLTVGMGIGIVDDSDSTICPLFALDSNVTLGAIIRSSDLEADEYCVCITDVGNIFPDETVTYSVDVTHP